MSRQENGERGEQAPLAPGGAVDRGSERLEVSSGSVLIIDQFMLANKQFLAKFRQVGSAGNVREEELNRVAKMYGGSIISLAPGCYRVLRDPVRNVIILSSFAQAVSAPAEQAGDDAEEQQQLSELEAFLESQGNAAPIDHVFVDTRCLVFIDAARLADEDLVTRYCNFRSERMDKQARDLLREHGGAVRYGFNRYGDELGVFIFPEENLVALWPDIAG